MPHDSARHRATSASRAALTVGDDPREAATRLLALHAAWRTSRVVPAGLRPVVSRAWHRRTPPPAARGASTTPAPSTVKRAEPLTHLSDADVRSRRAVHTDLAALVPGLRATLLDVAVEASNELVVCDADGFVLWLDGPHAVRRSSERLGFVEGACWREDTVGANALGTALVDREPVQIFGAEHTDEGHHHWVCTGAPIVDPASGQCVGAFTLSGPLRSVHPNTLALVTAAARTAQAHLAGLHRDRLRALAEEAGDGEGIVVDSDGWVAAAQGFRVGERVWLPGAVHAGTVHVPGLGIFDAEPAGRSGSGWHLRPQRLAEPTHLRLASGPECTVTVLYPDRHDTVPVTPRQRDLLLALAEAPAGLSAGDLAARVYGSAARDVTARAEISRLRRRLGDVLATRPYRLTVPLVGP